MTNYDKLLQAVRDMGMDYRWSKMFVEKIAIDERAFPHIDADTKKWALERGHIPGYVEIFGLTEDNYKDYIPEFNYFMLHPLNNHFKKWLDKTTLKYVLNSNGCASSMPDYYLYIENEKCGGGYTYLMDCPQDVKKNQDFIINLLKKYGILAMKPNSGSSGGVGFIKLELRDGNLYENNKRIDINRYEYIKNSMRNYIVTQYVKQHHKLAEVWPDSECTLRIVMAKSPKKNVYDEDIWFNVLSFARFGTSISGGASNMSAGGIAVGFDYDTGICNGRGHRSRVFMKYGPLSLSSHPDTNVSLDGFELPNWQYVKDMIERVCKHISSLEFLGFDIIITESGMKICEINSHPAMDIVQNMSSRPPMTDPRVREYFYHKGLFDCDAKALYKAYIDCQQ